MMKWSKTRFQGRGTHHNIWICLKIFSFKGKNYGFNSSEISIWSLIFFRCRSNNVEGDTCKRCNCKRSKCLKLWVFMLARNIYCFRAYVNGCTVHLRLVNILISVATLLNLCGYTSILDLYLDELMMMSCLLIPEVSFHTGSWTLPWGFWVCGTSDFLAYLICAVTVNALQLACTVLTPVLVKVA